MKTWQDSTSFCYNRHKVRENHNGYIASPVVTGTMNQYILSPGLEKRSGILGAMAMAKNLIERC